MRCVDSYEDLVPEGSLIRSLDGGAATPTRRSGGSPTPAVRRTSNGAKPGPIAKAASTVAQGRNNILYDRLPTPVSDYVGVHFLLKNF